ncbi:hypothetical protein BRADI_3g19643v3 [Brachypodium distachyon]|uniref:Uncharacterized protein n=1 Tax=Brachypodium distachyon TaxID=15368 RepID=A0A2K2CYB1_BRADI|nr:hypothetical protein BRADI_3g19643v3 [Brachypodium distachyon]
MMMIMFFLLLFLLNLSSLSTYPSSICFYERHPFMCSILQEMQWEFSHCFGSNARKNVISGTSGKETFSSGKKSYSVLRRKWRRRVCFTDPLTPSLHLLPPSFSPRRNTSRHSAYPYRRQIPQTPCASLPHFPQWRRRRAPVSPSTSASARRTSAATASSSPPCAARPASSRPPSSPPPPPNADVDAPVINPARSPRPRRAPPNAAAPSGSANSPPPTLRTRSPRSSPLRSPAAPASRPRFLHRLPRSARTMRLATVQMGCSLQQLWHTPPRHRSDFVEMSHARIQSMQ